jgi:hypothetical protein
LIPAHPVSSAQQHSPAQEAFRPRRPSQPSPSSSQAGPSCHPGRAAPHAAVPASPPPSFLLHGRRADYPASPTESPPLPTTPIFLSMPNWPTLMPPQPAAARCPRSLPGPIKGAHTPIGAHCPRLHSPFLHSSLGAPPSLSHFVHRHLSLSPGHLATFCSHVRSQAGSSPPSPPFWLQPSSIGEPERRPSRSSVSSRCAPFPVHGALVVHPVHTTMNPVHDLFPFRNNSYY